MSFLGEIKRRKVFQVAGVYLVVAWLTMQVVDVVNEPLSLPDWFDTIIILLLAIGFPVAVILSWAFDLGPSGIVRDSRGTVNLASGSRRIEAVLIVSLVLAIGWIGFRELTPQDPMTAGLIPNSVAVLPFDNVGTDDEEARGFRDGIHGELLAQLAKIRSLTSISRTSVLQYRDTQKSLPQIGDELGVASILEGEVQRAAGMVQITARLINAITDEQLWADSYEETLTAENIFAIQRDMATAIASALQATLTPEEVARLNEVPTRSEAAWEQYRAGDDDFWRTDFVTFTPRAIERFKRAVAEDPSFALAWAALSRAHIRMHWQGLDPDTDHRDLARWALEKAFALDSDLPEAHLAQGVFQYMANRAYATALANIEIAERSIPGAVEIDIAKADIYRRRYQTAESTAAYERAVERDPRNFFLLWQLANNYAWDRNYDLADAAMDRALELSPNELRVNRLKIFVTFMDGGELSRVRSELERPNTELGVYRPIFQSLAAIYEGDYRRAQDYLTDVEDRDLQPLGGASAPTVNQFIVKSRLLALTYDLAGQIALAEEQYRSAHGRLLRMQDRFSDDPDFFIALGDVLAGLGDLEGAANSARAAISLAALARDSRTEAGAHMDAAFIFARIGDLDSVIVELDIYLSNPGTWSIEGLARDPRLASVRNDLRFSSLMEKYGRSE